MQNQQSEKSVKAWLVWFKPNFWTKVIDKMQQCPIIELPEWYPVQHLSLLFDDETVSTAHNGIFFMRCAALPTNKSVMCKAGYHPGSSVIEFWHVNDRGLNPDLTIFTFVVLNLSAKFNKYSAIITSNYCK